MRQSHLMVLVNIILLAVLLLIFLLYRYKFKKNIPPPIIIAITSLLPIVHIFRPGMYESGDLWIHVTRFLQFYQSLKDGVLFPIWAKDLNFTYGYPILLFDPNLQYYVSSLFSLPRFFSDYQR